MARMFIFGLGYTARRIASALQAEGWQIDATGQNGNIAFGDTGGVRAALGRATHVLSSVPPARDSGADDVLACYGNMLGDGQRRWLGYLSSTGVYGNCGGAWVDESAPVGTGRRTARAAADAAWLARGAHVLRLPGIYGPGRSALDRVRHGTARRIDLPGQLFSRVHVDDIVAGTLAALDAPPGAYNLADDAPCSQNEVIEGACRLLGCKPPPLQTLDEAGLSAMARGFYTESRRVANGKARRILHWAPRYRDWQEGLRAILADGG